MFKKMMGESASARGGRTMQALAAAALAMILTVQTVSGGCGSSASTGAQERKEDIVFPEKSEAVLLSEFIYESAPFPSCHASTIEETEQGLIAAWFGGTAEKNRDVGIWVSRKKDGAWTAPVEAANGVQNENLRYPCWNPVLFKPSGRPLILFYKVGPDPEKWWGMFKTSKDGGVTWSEAARLPGDFLGPVKNKPVLLGNGSLLCPSSTESPEHGWRVHMELSKEFLKTWEWIGPLNDGREFGAIQPSVLVYPDGRMQILCRSRQRAITQCWSGDGGKTWSRMEATELPNPNSGIDAVMLGDGTALLVHNHTRRGRSPLNVSISRDGVRWEGKVVLESEPGEYSYPAVIQTSDGLVHITYTWKRQRIRHVVLDPEKFSFEK